MSTARLSRARLFAGMLLYTAVACGKSTAPLATLPPCEGPLTVAVSPGLHPSISWTPQCALNRILVDDPSAGLDRFPSNWDLVLRTGQFGPPVEYGTAPDSASVIELLFPLKMGRTYHVTVLRASGAVTVSSGSAAFTP